MSLAFTLSFGGVDFCLSPEGAQSSGGASEEGPSDAQIVSVKQTGHPAGRGSADSGREIIAELSGFSGTLRISLSASASLLQDEELSQVAAAGQTQGDDAEGTPEKGRALVGRAPEIGSEQDDAAELSEAGTNKKGDRASKWQTLRTRLQSGSIGGAGGGEPVSMEDSMDMISEHRSVDFPAPLPPSEDTLGLLVSERSLSNSDDTFSLDDEVANDSDTDMGGEDSATTKPFQKLLAFPSMSMTDDVPPAAPMSSPLHGRDRPFRKIAIAAMAARREQRRQEAAAAAAAEGGGKADGDRCHGSSETMRQMSAVNFEGDARAAENGIAAGTVGSRTRGGALDSGIAALVPTSMAPRISRSTPLHLACANSNVTLSQLRSILESDPGAASVKDDRGKLPIHIITENESMLQYQRRREDVGTFIRDLCDVDAMGIITEDNGGNIPLAPIIRHWIQNSYRAVYEQSASGKSAAGSEKSVLTYLGFARYSRGKEVGRTPDEVDSKDGGAGRMPSLTEGGAVGGEFNGLFPDVYTPPVVEWALVMLSLALDNFGGPLSRERGTRLEQLTRRQALAERIATIPLFLKTVLLIEDGDTRSRILELSVVRRVMLCSLTVDRWIVGMLQKPGAPSRRIVDYFLFVSELDVSDYIGKDRGPRQADYASFQREKGVLFDAIQSYNEILPSLLILPKKELEHVSRSRVVWQVLDETISRPFVIGIVMIDFVLHLTLLIVFRVDIADAAHALHEPGLVSRAREVSAFLIFCILLHQLLRKASEAAYLFLISPTVFRSYFVDLWTIVDLLSISLVWVGAAQVYQPDPNPSSALLAVAMALLWLRLLGILKAINMHLATFILSIKEIVKDIRWYLLLVAVCIIMFADMIHIITTTSANGKYCEIDFDEEETRTREDFCSDHILYSYLRMYAVLVGDFDIDDYRTTPFISALFILFTVLGVVVLLNVLIAVVCDSYEKSRVRSAYLFGRARVGFAAEHAALEAFLMQPRNRIHLSDFLTSRVANILWLCGRIFRWSILLSLVATAGATDYFLVYSLVQDNKDREAVVLLIVLVFILAIILNIAILDILRFLFKGCSCSKSLRFFASSQRNDSSGQSSHQRILAWLSNLLNLCLGFIARKLFGIKCKEDDLQSDPTPEWEGRLEYIEQQTSKIVRESERRINEKVKESEKRIREYDQAAKTELQRDIGNVLNAVKKYR